MYFSATQSLSLVLWSFKSFVQVMKCPLGWHMMKEWVQLVALAIWDSKVLSSIPRRSQCPCFSLEGREKILMVRRAFVRVMLWQSTLIQRLAWFGFTPTACWLDRVQNCLHPMEEHWGHMSCWTFAKMKCPYLDMVQVIPTQREKQWYHDDSPLCNPARPMYSSWFAVEPKSSRALCEFFSGDQYHIASAALRKSFQYLRYSQLSSPSSLKHRLSQGTKPPIAYNVVPCCKQRVFFRVFGNLETWSNDSCWESRPIPFDFLVDGEFLRSSIGTYLEVEKNDPSLSTFPLSKCHVVFFCLTDWFIDCLKAFQLNWEWESFCVRISLCSNFWSFRSLKTYRRGSSPQRRSCDWSLCALAWHLHDFLLKGFVVKTSKKDLFFYPFLSW